MAVLLACSADLAKLQQLTRPLPRAVQENLQDGLLQCTKTNTDGQYVEEADICGSLVNTEVEEDDEAQTLHQQTVEVLQRLTQLRASVPQAVHEQVTVTLEQQRPAKPAHDPLVGEAGRPEAKVEQLLPDAQNLQGLLSLTSKRLPSLRAKLEEALARLERVLQATAGSGQLVLPNTVQKVLASQPGDTRVAEEGDAQSAALATRCLLARDLCTPCFPAAV